jgi:parvulin-like peptidyl-prolyl isomerase
MAIAWYLEKVSIGGIQLPFDYVTLIVGVISIYVLYNGLFGGGGKSKASCTASHILIDKSDDATRDRMEAWKKSIGSDAEAFAKCAKENSTCPSKSKGGLLGTFPRGAMVPPFDKRCFDPSTPIQTTVGPVQTHFGYHLIYIHDRKLPSQ